MTHAPYTRSAEIYDVIYGDASFDYPGHAAAITRHIEEQSAAATSLLEFGCGTGRFVEQLQGRFDVTGVDISAEMLEVAAVRFPDRRFVQGDMRDVVLDGSYDAVVCLFSSLGYMTTEADLQHAVTAMTAHLTEGGVFVADGWLRPEVAIDGYVSVGSHQAGDVAVARMSFTRIVGATTEMEMHHLVGRAGRGVETYMEHHVMGLFTDEQYVAALNAAGLVDVTVVDGYPGRGRFVGVRRGGRS